MQALATLEEVVRVAERARGGQGRFLVVFLVCVCCCCFFFNHVKVSSLVADSCLFLDRAPLRGSSVFHRAVFFSVFGFLSGKVLEPCLSKTFLVHFSLLFLWRRNRSLCLHFSCGAEFLQEDRSMSFV